MKWFVGIGGILLLIAIVPLAIEYPAEVGVGFVGVFAFWWLVKQGLWRSMYVLVIVTTLGAISSVAPWVAVSTYGRVVAVGGLLLATYWVTRNETAVATRGTSRWILKCLALLAIVASVSVVWSVSVVDTITQAALFIALVLIMRRLVARRWIDRKALVGDFSVAVTVLSLSMLIGIAAHFAGLLPTTFSGRFQGLFNNPNLAAIIALLTMFLAWGLFLESRGVLRLLLVVPPFLTIALTETRAAFVAALIGVIWMGARAGWRMFFLTAAILATVAALGAPLWMPVIDRFGVISAGDAFAGRTIGWETALHLLTLRPVGYGWATTQSVFASAYDSGLSAFRPQSAHNSYLQLLLEVNWVGAAILALVLIGVVVLIFRQRPTGIEVGFSGAVVAGLVIQASESPLFGTGQPYPWLYWFAIAGLMAMHRPRERKTVPTYVRSRKYRHLVP